MKFWFSQSKNKSNSPNHTQITKNYFCQATSWADDLYTKDKILLLKYQRLLVGGVGLICILSISLSWICIAKKAQTLIIHQASDGTYWVQPIMEDQPILSASKGQTENDLIRYVTARESFSPVDYDDKYSLVELLSDAEISQDYIAEQRAENPLSLVKQFGNRIIRTVKIENIIFLDNENTFAPKKINRVYPHANLAEIYFKLTDVDQQTKYSSSSRCKAIISWDYQRPPSLISDRWRNWDGFRVTRYDKEEISSKL